MRGWPLLPVFVITGCYLSSHAWGTVLTAMFTAFQWESETVLHLTLIPLLITLHTGLEFTFLKVLLLLFFPQEGLFLTLPMTPGSAPSGL